MIAEFETDDGAKFQVNTDSGEERWSMQFGDGDDMQLASGKLTPSGMDIWSMEPRTPKTEGPGAGLSTLVLKAVVEKDTLYIVAGGNVHIKNFTLPKPIVNQRYEVLG